MNATVEYMVFLSVVISKTEAELFARIESYYAMVELLSTIPGITPLSAVLILSEIGFDMSIFDFADHPASWAGFAPANNESDGKEKPTRISKEG